MPENHSGHRSRMFDKIKREEVLCPHEYLEMLLMYAIPRKNTNDIAHRLLSHFQDLDGVFSASVNELCVVKGVGERTAIFLHTLGKLWTAYPVTSDYYTQYPNAFHKTAFADYIKKRYRGVLVEVLDVYCLDSEGNIFHKQSFTSLDKNQVKVLADKVASLLLDENPSGIILVHNHPYSTSVPSKSDDAMTRIMQVMCNIHNVLLCNHLICGIDGVYDYYSSGKLRVINSTCNLDRLLEMNEEEILMQDLFE